MNKYILPALIVLLAIVLRFWGLGDRPLWMDEALFYSFVTEGSSQEFVPVFFTKILDVFVNIHDEFWLRFPFALAGVLCVVAIFLVKGLDKQSLILATFFAVFPPFVFWSQMARPYIFASLFIILGYRWWFIHILGILTTPLSVVGVNLIKYKNWPYYIGLALFAYILLQVRPDIDRGFNLEFLQYAKRIWIIPFTIISLYVDDLCRCLVQKRS